MVGVGGSWARRQETAPRRAAKASKAQEFDFIPAIKSKNMTHRKLIDLKVWFPAVLRIKGPRDCAVLFPSSASPINKMPALLERLIPPKKSAYGSTMTR